jgi:hypothetical protein
VIAFSTLPSGVVDGLLGAETYLGKGEAAHTVKLNSLRMALLVGFHSRHKREIVLSAATAYSRPFTAQVGVIQLEKYFQYSPESARWLIKISNQEYF